MVLRGPLRVFAGSVSGAIGRISTIRGAMKHPDQKTFVTYQLTVGSALYFGVTSSALSKRLSRHFCDARRGLDRVHHVLARTPRSSVAIEPLAGFATEAEAEGYEGRRIAAARAAGLQVLNGHEEGRGPMLPEAKARMQRPHAKAQRGPVLDKKTGVTYPTSTAAAVANGIEPRNLSEALRTGEGGRYAGHARRFARITDAAVNDNGQRARKVA